MNKYTIKKAFSLIELSIVILIIGILVAGVTQSSRLVTKMRLQTAQNITNSSPIPSIKDLVFWFETSLESSFNDSEEQNNASITMWYDNIKQSSIKTNISPPASATNQPKFTENAFGAIPSVKFDGDDYFNIDGNIFVNTDFTMFIVERKIATDTWMFHPGGVACGTNECLHIGYRTNNWLTLAFYANDLECNGASISACAPLANSQTRIHTFYFSKSVGRKYWLNGGVNPEVSDSVLSAINSPKTNKIGNAYNGEMAEIILFNRALKNEERQSIEDYLSRKYSIKIS
jgi:prepilin-type N-terminal cleavage/methylation domain-containing protein